MKAIGYIRVSTSEQTLGSDAQRDALEKWCTAHGAELVEVHEDHGVSGGAAIDQRPGLLAAVDAVDAHGAGLLLVAKRDRLARDVIVAAMVERLVSKSGARVESADGAGAGDSPEALLMRRMVDAFAEYERALIRARTKTALAALRRAGKHTGGSAPYGYRVGRGGVLDAVEHEQTAIAMARDLRACGESYRRIGAQLSAAGMVPRRGERWQATQIRRMVAAEFDRG